MFILTEGEAEKIITIDKNYYHKPVYYRYCFTFGMGVGVYLNANINRHEMDRHKLDFKVQYPDINDHNTESGRTTLLSDFIIYLKSHNVRCATELALEYLQW